MKNRNKSAILNFIPAIIELVRELLITCIKNLERIHEKRFKLSRPQGQIIDVNAKKLQ